MANARLLDCRDRWPGKSDITRHSLWTSHATAADEGLQVPVLAVESPGNPGINTRRHGLQASGESCFLFTVHAVLPFIVVDTIKSSANIYIHTIKFKHDSYYADCKCRHSVK